MLEPLVHGRTRGLVLPHPEDPRFNGREKQPEISEYQKKKKKNVPKKIKKEMGGFLDLQKEDEKSILRGCWGMN